MKGFVILFCRAILVYEITFRFWDSGRWVSHSRISLLGFMHFVFSPDARCEGPCFVMIYFFVFCELCFVSHGLGFDLVVRLLSCKTHGVGLRFMVQG